MKITLKGIYKSLSDFESDELHDFCVITGKNGSGKTQLIESIEKTVLSGPNQQNRHTTTISPNITKVKIWGIENMAFESLGFGGIKGKLDEYANVYNSIFKEHSVHLFTKLVEKKVTIDRLFPYDKKIWDDLLDTTDSMGFLQNYLYEGDGNTQYVGTFDTDKVIEFIEKRLRPYAKFVEVFILIAEKTKKRFKELQTADFHSFPIPEKYIDNLSLFDSKLEVIFWNYARRRSENYFEDLEKRQHGITNNSIPAEEFDKLFPPPWQTLNRLLKDSNINLEFIEVGNKAALKGEPVVIQLRKCGQTIAINPSDISSGEKVIIGLVIKLFAQSYYEDLSFPEVIILDEPDAHLHPELTNLLIKVLYETFVLKLGIKVLITTHSPSTIALAPEESIYELKNAPTTSLQKISKDDALKLLTGFIPTLSINYKNHRQVFAESSTDVTYFQAIYTKIKSKVKLNHELYFIESGRGKTNCEWVKSIVSQLRSSGNTTVFGVVDWDSHAKGTTEILVHGQDLYYSIENIILDPIYLVVYFLEEKRSDVYAEFGFDRNFNEYSIGEETEEKLSKIWKWVTNRLLTEFPVLKKDEATIKLHYLNGISLDVPRWYVQMKGHDLEEKLKEVFPALAIPKFKAEGALQKHLTTIIAKCYPLIPKCTVDTLAQLGNN